MAITFKSVLAAVRARLQTKTVYPGLVDKTYYPDAGYDGFESFTVRLVEQDFINNRATPTESEQTVRPSSGFFSEFIVEPIPSRYKIPLPITPSDSAPASMSSDIAYEPDSAGYAIQSYQSITPASGGTQGSGTYFSSGMVKMSTSGYAYRSPHNLTNYLLWSNSNTSTSFATATISLTYSVRNYPWFLVKFKNYRTDSDSGNAFDTYFYAIWETTSSAVKMGLIGTKNGTSYARTVYYVSDTSVRIGDCYRLTSSNVTGAMDNNYVIPIAVYGVRYS